MALRLFCLVEIHCNGHFVRRPLSYANGITHLVDDHDFSQHCYAEFLTWFQQYLGEEFRQLYYCEPEKPLYDGLRPLGDDEDYMAFIFDAYGTDGKIKVYVDHDGVDVSAWFMNEDDEDAEENEADEPEVDNLMEVDDGDFDEVTPVMRRTANDEFLSKLSSPQRDAGNDNNRDDDDEVADPNVQVNPIFDENLPWKLQIPILGMRFKDPAQMKTMLCNYAVANGYQLCFVRNDRTRLLVKCCKGECTFRLWGSWMTDEQSFQIKSLNWEHNCARNFKLGSLVTYAWLGSHYKKEILHREKMSVRKLRVDVIKKFGVQVSLGQCRRAKKYAISLIQGDLEEHYSKLWSYAAEIRRSNPGSTVQLCCNTMPDGKRYFTKFYVCLEALKKGWKEGCRKIIGLDGCFLKGVIKGELLSAIGRDANDQIYPIAWAVVGVESKETWRWFLENLTDDLNLNLGNGYTFMSDQNKGLIEAMKSMLPFAEHRQCARHICQNLMKRYPNAYYETLFWRACKATTEPDFQAPMKQLETLNPNAHKYLLEKDPKTWSRAFYQTGRCCDSVENGMSESFNALVVEARKQPIITMLEEIRLYMMERVYNMKRVGQQWGNEVCKGVRGKCNVLKKDQRNWVVKPSGLNNFEVKGSLESFIVDLDGKTCSCRLWQLNGYGCVHSAAAICFLHREIESYADPVYSSVSYMKAYNYRIGPMNGAALWPETAYPPPLPPIARRMPGRPTTKRKRHAVEKRGRQSMSKAGKKGRCSICKEEGHNKSTCRLSRPNGNNSTAQENGGDDDMNYEADHEAFDEAEMQNGENMESEDDMWSLDDDMGPLDETPRTPVANEIPAAQVAPVQPNVEISPIQALLQKMKEKKAERMKKLEVRKRATGNLG